MVAGSGGRGGHYDPGMKTHLTWRGGGFVGMGLVVLAGGWSGAVNADTGFRVKFEAGVRGEAASGRLVVYLVKEGAKVEGDEPADGPFFEEPQPMFGVTVSGVKPGEWITVDAESLEETAANQASKPRSFRGPINELPVGSYRVQAVLDMKRENSSWRREAGNLYSAVKTVKVNADGAKNGVTEIVLTKAISASDVRLKVPKGAGTPVEYVEVKSELLSKFRGRDVMMRAGVVLPNGYDAKREGGYAAVYEVPGFGGNHEDARHVMRVLGSGTSPASILSQNTFWIVLDPEGPNGHHLFADSANNGPVGEALVTELIPTLEKKYNLAASAKARLLRGHSSGGWSTLWLATRYPQTFGGAWSSSPDPVDFRKFQLVDLYRDLNAYTRDSKAVPSYRSKGQVRMTIAEENAMEDVLGPDNTSGQQWDSWFAAFGPKNERGNPAAVWDAATGVIDHVIAEQYVAFDIADRMKKEPAKLGPLFKQRVRLIVGDQDNYFLNEAVAMLKAQVDRLNFIDLPEGSHGGITIVPGKDHGTIYMTKEMQGIPGEMAEHLKRNGLVK